MLLMDSDLLVKDGAHGQTELQRLLYAYALYNQEVHSPLDDLVLMQRRSDTHREWAWLRVCY